MQNAVTRRRYLSLGFSTKMAKNCGTVYLLAVTCEHPENELKNNIIVTIKGQEY